MGLGGVCIEPRSSGLVLVMGIIGSPFNLSGGVSDPGMICPPESEKSIQMS